MENAVVSTNTNPIEIVSSVDSFQLVGQFTEENSVKTGRGRNGRFINGNNFSVGNKGGRPKNITLEDVLMDPERLEVLCEKAMEDGDTDSILAVLDLMEGKKVSSSCW